MNQEKVEEKLSKVFSVLGATNVLLKEYYRIGYVSKCFRGGGGCYVVMSEDA
jgi:hypothetical protein